MTTTNWIPTPTDSNDVLVWRNTSFPDAVLTVSRKFRPGTTLPIFFVVVSFGDASYDCYPNGKTTLAFRTRQEAQAAAEQIYNLTHSTLTK